MRKHFHVPFAAAVPQPTMALPQAMFLHELRQARGLSQDALAQLLNVQQPNIARQENQRNMHLRTLRHYIEAMGGQLEVTARFPDGAVRIANF